jgi:hypothetical protein
MVGRLLMYTTLTVLALFVAATYLILDHGGGTIAQVQDVTLHNLTASSASYDGQPVTTSGTLQVGDDGDWEISEDDANFPVEVRNFEDESLLQSLDGHRVKVHGIFGIESEGGVYINADTVHAAGE